MVEQHRLRVVVADDHARIRAKVHQALEAGGWEVCGEGATAGESIKLAMEHRPDLGLLDINMPGNGIFASREISRRLPETAVVMLTQSADDEELFDSLRAGASGYLLKSTDPPTLTDVLRGVLSGEVANELFVSTTTVRVHVSTVLRKLRVKDRESAFQALRE